LNKNSPKIQWAAPSIGRDEQNAVMKVIRSGWMTQGKITESLEKRICDESGAKYTVVTNNGTSALICSLLANGIGPGDEVIVPSFTFIASVNSIIAVGAKPILVDSDPYTFNTTVDLVKRKITHKTRAILPVDVSGMPVDINEFRNLAEKQKIILIEDAAEAIGAEYRHKKIGSFDHSTVFSFHMAKLVTSIEGGCIVTNSKDIAYVAKLIRSHGDAGKYDSQVFGLNLRISDIHSAIALEQMKKINRFISHRNKLALIYRDELQNSEFQQIPDYVSCHPYMLFAILVSPRIRNKLNSYLNRKGIETRICWPPVHKQKCHLKIFKNYNLPGAESIYSKIINLPMGNGLTENEVMYVVQSVKKGMQILS